MNKIICLIIFLISASTLFGQQFNHSFGIKLSISIAPIKQSSGATISMTYGIYRLPKEESFNFIPAYQFSINGYLNGIGTRYDINEFMIDIHNSISISTYTDKLRVGKINIKPEFHYIESTYFSNINLIPLSSSASLTISSNHILNFDGRHQRYGGILGQVGKFRIQHYNDGGIIMGNLKLGDGNDRWWTGGAFIEYGYDIHHDSLMELMIKPRKIRFSFDRFTWDNKVGLELATKDRHEFIPITIDKQSEVKYNFGKYGITIFGGQFIFGVEANNILKDLQDLLHEKGKLAKHPTIASKYYSTQFAIENRYGINR